MLAATDCRRVKALSFGPKELINSDVTKSEVPCPAGQGLSWF